MTPLDYGRLLMAFPLSVHSLFLIVGIGLARLIPRLLKRPFMGRTMGISRGGEVTVSRRRGAVANGN